MVEIFIFGFDWAEKQIASIFNKLCCSARFNIITVCLSVFAIWCYEQVCAVIKYIIYLIVQ